MFLLNISFRDVVMFSIIYGYFLIDSELYLMID